MVKMGLAHVAPEEKPLRLGIVPDPVPEIGWEFQAFRQPVEHDEVIHSILHQGEAKRDWQ
jgi:hypothetical protein